MDFPVFDLAATLSIKNNKNQKNKLFNDKHIYKVNEIYSLPNANYIIIYLPTVKYLYNSQL